MASADLELVVHRSGRPVEGSVKVRVLDRRGSPFTSGYTNGGKVQLKVPENEMYRIVLETYGPNYYIDVLAHRGLCREQFDLDKYHPR